MCTPNRAELNEVFNDNAVIQLDNIIDVFTDVNHSSAAWTRRQTYDNPVTIANGCIRSMGFEHALTHDIVSRHDTLPDTVATVGCRRSSAFYRTLHETTDRCLDEGGAYGALDAVVVTSNQKQAQRSRIKTFARHWLTNISNYYSDHHIEGTNYVEINNEENATEGYLAVTAAGIGIIYSHTYSRIYVIFNEYPYSYIRTILRGEGFTKAGTNNLWYANREFNNAEEFSTFVNQLLTSIRGVYDLKVAESSLMSSALGSIITSTETTAQDQPTTSRRGRRRTR